MFRIITYFPIPKFIHMNQTDFLLKPINLFNSSSNVFGMRSKSWPSPYGVFIPQAQNGPFNKN